MVFNSYPNAANKPRFSFDVPVTPPDIDPDEGDTVCMALSVLWLPVVLAALQQLTLYATWEGTDEEKLLAVQRAVNLMEIVGTAEGQCGTGQIPTPFWDDATDVDDEATPDVQTWYGYVEDPDAEELTFIEDATIWAFTGLVAYAGGIGAAIAFRTVAPAFVLQARGKSTPEVIRVFVDGYLSGEYDTTGHEDEIIEMPVYGDADLTEHQIYVVKAG